jgi:non-ribosomal peptide synthetase component F
MTGELPIDIAPGDRTLPRLLNVQAARHGNRALFASNGETWTFAEPARIAACMAGALRNAGVQAGDRVAILCSNRPEFLARRARLRLARRRRRADQHGGQGTAAALPAGELGGATVRASKIGTLRCWSIARCRACRSTAFG